MYCKFWDRCVVHTYSRQGVIIFMENRLSLWRSNECRAREVWRTLEGNKTPVRVRYIWSSFGGTWLGKHYS